MDSAIRTKLLTIARAAVEAVVRGDRPPPLPDDPSTRLNSSGVFVTIRNAGRLRGCMGTFGECDDLGKAVADIARTAARDPRFIAAPITPDELPEIRLEISVLSPLQRTDDPLSLELGRHGIYVVRGNQSGCFLPQVATEQGWDKEQFLERCCRTKAGLAPDAWRDPQTDVYLFTSEKFAEYGFHEENADQNPSVRASQ